MVSLLDPEVMDLRQGCTTGASRGLGEGFQEPAAGGQGRLGQSPEALRAANCPGGQGADS